MQDIDTVGIIAKPGIARGYELIPELISWLENRGVRTRYDRQTAIYSGRDDGFAREHIPEGARLSSCSAATALCSPPLAPSAAARS